MASHVFTLPRYDAGADVYFRIFNDSGQVFDFSDLAFKALASATTPYIAATERADMDGTGFSAYQATLNLAQINGTPTSKHYTLKAYNNAAPADTDVAVSDALDVVVQLGELGEGELIGQAEVSVKSTAGTTAQAKAWLERNGRKVTLDDTGGIAFTADAGTDTITSAAHGLANADRVFVSSQTTLPGGLSASTVYYVISAAANTFQLAATEGGAAINITTAGTGVHKWHKPTATVTLREHGSGVDLFSKALTASDLEESLFEGEQATPGFTDDRQYDVEVAITIGGVTVTTHHSAVVIG